MFPGRTWEAKWLRQMYKGQPVEKGGKLWEEAIRDDFKESAKRWLRHARMAEIEALLAPAARDSVRIQRRIRGINEPLLLRRRRLW